MTTDDEDYSNAIIHSMGTAIKIAQVMKERNIYKSALEALAVQAESPVDKRFSEDMLQHGREIYEDPTG